MAFMLLRACRDAARVPASAASRCAAVAAASNQLMRRSPIVSPPLGMGLTSHRGFLSSPCRAMSNNTSSPPEGKVNFVVDSKDLDSEIGMWHLYERWCKAFGQKRDKEEMLRRFAHFKSTVLFVDRMRRQGAATFTINKFADGMMRQRRIGRRPYLRALTAGYDKEEPEWDGEISEEKTKEHGLTDHIHPSA